MLFNNKQPRCCQYCIHAKELDEDSIHCSKKGIRPPDSKCLFYQYDPCKRKPKKSKAIDFTKYEEYDYSL